MSLSITFGRQARREFDEAADWYEQHRAGLGARFVTAVQHVLDEAARNPQRSRFLTSAKRQRSRSEKLPT